MEHSKTKVEKVNRLTRHSVNMHVSRTRKLTFNWISSAESNEKNTPYVKYYKTIQQAYKQDKQTDENHAEIKFTVR